MNDSVQKLVLVVKGVDSGETLERWVFNCETTKTNDKTDIKSTKPEKDIMQEVQAIMRQITASVTFLPLLNEPCCFDLLVYADQEAAVPVTWEDSDPCFIANSEDVRLRSFTTQVYIFYYQLWLLFNGILSVKYTSITSQNKQYCMRCYKLFTFD